MPPAVESCWSKNWPAARSDRACARGHAEIIARIQDLDVDGSVKDAWFKRAEAIDPELWMTPESVLEGVRNADAQYDKLRADLARVARRSVARRE